MTASTKELVIICSEVGTRDYLPSELRDKLFRDVSDWLWKKYPDQITSWIQQELGGMETPSRQRAELLFDYADAAGDRIPIDQSEAVAKIAQLTSQVQWHPQAVGGSSFRQTFGMHAAEILANPRYRNWHCVANGSPGYGIRAVGPDPHGIIRTWTITPPADYPNSPPTVISEPPYTHDVCWGNGILHYTRYTKRYGSPWQDLARRSTNPLLALIIELLQKYRLAV